MYEGVRAYTLLSVIAVIAFIIQQSESVMCPGRRPGDGDGDGVGDGDSGGGREVLIVIVMMMTRETKMTSTTASCLTTAASASLTITTTIATTTTDGSRFRKGAGKNKITNKVVHEGCRVIQPSHM